MGHERDCAWVGFGVGLALRRNLFCLLSSICISFDILQEERFGVSNIMLY